MMHKLLTFFLLLLAVPVLAQPPGRTISAFPYTQDFSFVVGGTTPLTSFPSTDVSGGEFTVDDSTASVWATTISAAGLADVGGKIRIQTTDPKTRQGFIWYGDFSGRNVDSIVLDWNKVANGSFGSRVNEVRIATNGGEGSVFTDITDVTWPQFDNTSTSQSGTLRVKLPISLHDKADLRIRIYAYHTGSGSGNHPRVDVDNLRITARCLGPATATIDSVGSAGISTLWLYFTPGDRTDSMLVIRREGAAPTALPTHGSRYSVGQGLNGTDTVVFWGPASAGRAFSSKLKSGTSYHFAVYGHRSCANEYAAVARGSGTTLTGCSGNPGQVTGLQVKTVGTTDVTVDFRAGGRTDSILILRRLNAPPGSSPTMGVRYTVGQTIGVTSAIAYFGPPVGPVKLTGLQADSTYVLAYYGFQTCNGAYTQIGTLDTARTLCTGVPLNLSDLSVRAVSSASVGLQMTLTGFADHYLVLKDGGDGRFPTLVEGTAYRVGDVVGDDTVQYYGTGRKPTILGLRPATSYKFYGFGVRECNWSFSARGDSVTGRTLAACSGPLALTNPQGFTIVKNVKDTLQLRWNTVAGADSFVVVARIDSTPVTVPQNGVLYDRNDAVGSGFALATVADTTATVLRLPINTAYFLRVYALRRCDLGYGGASTTLPLATPGTSTQQRFVIRANTAPTLEFAGATIKFTKSVAADGSLLIARQSGAPGLQGLPFFRAGDKPVNIVSPDRWWSFARVGLDSFHYDMKLDISKLPGMSDTGDLEVLYRPHSDSLWQDIVTSGYEVVRDTVLLITALDRRFFSDYAVGANNTRNVLPVNLISFDGYRNQGRAVLRWRTASEQHNAGFRLYRSPINADGQPRGFAFVADYLTSPSLRGAGTSSTANDYLFVDDHASLPHEGSLLYKLEEISVDGTIEEIGRVMVEADRVTSASRFGLEQVAPNPATGPTLLLRYVLPEVGGARIALFDAAGREARMLVDQADAPAGVHTVLVNIGDLPAGIYFCRMTAQGSTSVKSVVITR